MKPVGSENGVPGAVPGDSAGLPAVPGAGGDVLSPRRGSGCITEIAGEAARPGGRKVELVFRTVGERTSDLALELAVANIQPQRVHLLRDVRPWSVAVRRLLDIEHRCSHVVYVDADCLILEDIRPFLDTNKLASVRCYGHDRFRGPMPCGVHVLRLDVVEAMRQLPVQAGDLQTVLRPERHLRTRALARLGTRTQSWNVHVLNDYFQRLADVFVKYARRQLRNRAPAARALVDAWVAGWGSDDDFVVAHTALAHAASAVPGGASPRQVERYLHNLPGLALDEVRALGYGDVSDDPLTWDVLGRALASGQAPATRASLPNGATVFGIGLPGSRTDSLTHALLSLGANVLHYPDGPTSDSRTLHDGRVAIPPGWDGSVEPQAAGCFAEIDRSWPGSRFVLTTGGGGPEDARTHLNNVRRHFTSRPDNLLVLDLAKGDGYQSLAPFLGVAVPGRPVPDWG